MATVALDPFQADALLSGLDASAPPANGLVEQLSVATYTCDAAGRITSFNPQAVQFWGRVPRLNDLNDRFCGAFALHAPNGDAIHHDECWMALALRRNQAYSGQEAVIERPDGSRITVLASVHPMHDESGELQGAASVLVDITDVRRAEEVLRESEEHYRSLVELAQDAILILEDDLIRFCNPSGLAMLGASSPDALLGKPIGSFFHPEDRERAAARRRAIRETGRPVIPRSFRLLRLDDQQIDVEAYGAPCLYQGKPALQLVFRDIRERKEAERAIHKSQQQLAAIAATMPQALYVFDIVGMKHVYSNREVGHDLGYTAAELERLGPNFLDALLHPDDLARLPALIARWDTARDGEVLEVEYRVRHASGEWRWVLSRDTVYQRMPDGRVHQIIGTAQDITGRKQVEETLRTSEIRYRAIFDNAIEGFFQMTQEGSFLIVNPSLARILGYEAPEEVIAQLNKVDAELYVDSSRRQELLRCIETDGFVKGFESEIKRKDGSHTWVAESTRAVVDAAGKTLWYEGFVEDIGERKRAEEALRSSQASLRAIFDAVPDCVMLTTADGILVNMNAAGLALIDAVSLDQVKGVCIFPLVIPDHQQRFAEVIRRACLGEPGRMEFEIVGLQGTHRSMETSLVPFPHTVAEVPLALGITRDITERNKAEEGRRSLEAQFHHSRKLESLGVLAGGIAHDFNNLLTAMLGNASLARMHLPNESPACPMLREIEKAASRAADLSMQMLAYSGKARFVIATLRLDAMVQERAKVLGAMVSRKASLNFELEPAPVEGDAIQLRQVVVNLIVNASEALAGQCGAITIRTGVRQADETFLRSPYIPAQLLPGAYAYIEVEDTGCGMTAETLALIFDPFFTTKFTGRGLGLAVVLGVVKGHRGTVKVDSVVGRGTRFQVLFPCSTEPSIGGLVPGLVESPQSGRGIVLVVEDEPTIRLFVRRVLESAGFQVVEASDGQEGLDQFALHRPDIVVVLLDLTMPRMDGVEVLRRLRQTQPDLPVLVMSGFSEAEVSNRVTGLGANGFIQKPFGPRDLIARVCQILPPQASNVRQ